MYYLRSTALLPLLLAPFSLAAPTEPPNSSLIEARLPGPDSDGCDWAAKYMPYTYLNCFESLSEGPSQLQGIDYNIWLTGTGQDQGKWCQSIEANIQKACPGVGFTLTGGCGGSDTNTQVDTLDGDDNWKRVTLTGINLVFRLSAKVSGGVQDPGNPPFLNRNAHVCVSQGIEESMCGGRIMIANGAHCVARGYGNDHITEYETRPGPTSLDADP